MLPQPGCPSSSISSGKAYLILLKWFYLLEIQTEVLMDEIGECWNLHQNNTRKRGKEKHTDEQNGHAWKLLKVGERYMRVHYTTMNSAHV